MESKVSRADQKESNPSWYVKTREISLVLAALMVCLSATGNGWAVQDDTGLTQQDPPWLSGQEAAQLPPVSQLEPVDAFVNLDPSEIEVILDGMELDAQQETLLKVLYQIPQLSLADVERFVSRTDSVQLASVEATPREFRFQMFRLRGEIVEVETIRLDDQLAERFEFKNYYNVLLRIAETDEVVRISAREVPKSWGIDKAIGQDVGVNGLFFLSELLPESNEPVGSVDPGVDSNENGQRLRFIASRLQWYPVRNETNSSLSEGQIWLAGQGMDISRFEDVDGRDARPLGAEDSECFYQLLATMARVDMQNDDESASQTSRNELAALELIPLMRSPAEFRGHGVRIDGNVRRITRIEIDRNYFADRLGIDHYYQLDLFVDLKPNQVIRVSSKDGGEGPIFRNRFPVTVCVTNLPAGLQPQDKMNREISVNGYFMRTWSYPSSYAEQFGDNTRQIGPMFVGYQVQPSQPAASTSFITVLAAGFLIISLGGTWAAMLLLSRRNRATEQAIEKQHQGDPSFLAELEKRD